MSRVKGPTSSGLPCQINRRTTVTVRASLWRLWPWGQRLRGPAPFWHLKGLAPQALDATERKHLVSLALALGEQAPLFVLPIKTVKKWLSLLCLAKALWWSFSTPKTPRLAAPARPAAFVTSMQLSATLALKWLGSAAAAAPSTQPLKHAHQLPFVLLCDEEGAVRRLWRVPRSLAIFPGRVTYVLDKTGRVRHITHHLLAIDRHIQEALQAVERLKTAA